MGIKANNQYFCSIDNVGSKHSTYIIDKIHSLLKQAQIKIDEVDLIAYVNGPGSFTGLRVGLSVALGISFGLDINLVPVPAFALHAMAAAVERVEQPEDSYDDTNSMLSSIEQLKDDGVFQDDQDDILIGIDARIGQIYFAGVNLKTLDYFIEPQVINPDKIAVNRQYLLVGDGFNSYQNQLTDNLKECQVLKMNYPSAKCLLKIVELDKYVQVLSVDADLMYLRNKVALDLNEQQQFKP
ncbi:MAG: tRNA threonylcarbamoyladenosine biosynthesis protein TsaB [Pseudomonadota bacterium]|nr:tRNA threonylcarbamoyladenosine biosynthesis protein TsaB [Pseudomonadota bacterium]